MQALVKLQNADGITYLEKKQTTKKVTSNMSRHFEVTRKVQLMS